jgi:hypothetical protein
MSNRIKSVHISKAYLFLSILGASFGVIGAPAAHAATFTFQSPAGDVGNPTQAYTNGGLTITAAGFSSSNFTTPNVHLFDKTNTGDESGLGLTNDPAPTEDEITVGSYIRIAMPTGVTNVMFQMDSSTSPDAWAVYGSSSANPASLGAALMTGTSEETNVSLPTEAFYFFTATAGNVLIRQISMSAATTPLPAALPLFASGLGVMGLFGWRRKRKAQAAA